MKKTTALFLVLLSSLVLSASSFLVGGSASVTVNSVIAGENYRNYRYTSRDGVKLSVPVIWEFGKYTALESGLDYTTKNHHLARSYYDRVVDLDITNGFVSLPLALRLSLPLDDFFSLSLSLGGYAGFWCFKQSTGIVVGMSKEEQSVSEKEDLSLRNRFEYGVFLSLGFSFDFRSCVFSLFSGYSLDISDMNLPQKNGYPIHNSTFLLGAGLTWRVK